MEHITGKKVVHRDLALRNCLLSSNNQVKVADMGLSRALTQDGANYTMVGKLEWFPVFASFDFLSSPFASDDNVVANGYSQY